MSRRCFLACLLAVGSAVFAPLTAAAQLTVFAAASLKEALDANSRGFERATGHRVALSYAASNALARQIENGAPAHLFVSADRDWMDYLDRRGLLVPGSRRDLLGNRLVLVAPAGSVAALAIRPGLDLASALGGGRLAMANPDSVPAGKYGRAALETLGAWAAVEKRLARTENVRAALALVSRGEAPLGIVYRTDALADPRVRIVDTFPESSHPSIVYPAAQVRGADAAAGALLDYLAGPLARPIWEKHGFRLLR